MAIVFHSGFETGDFSEWDSTVGSPSLALGSDVLVKIGNPDSDQGKSV